jgi:hypothetical protein
MFKLADLGLTTFQVKLQKGEGVESRDIQGTQMFSKFHILYYHNYES